MPPSESPAPPLHPRAPLALTDLVVDRLRTSLATLRLAQVSGIAQIAGLTDLDAARPGRVDPFVGVLAVSDAARPNEAPDPDGIVVQRVTSTVSVVAGVATPNDPGGAKGAGRSDLTLLVEAVRLSLMGWAPGGRFPAHVEAGASPVGRWTSMVLTRGQLIGQVEGRSWWRDDFTAARLMRGSAEPDSPAAQVVQRLCLVLNSGDPEQVV